MDHLTTTMLQAMEQAGISGLCREGQLEIAVQEARKNRPDLDDEALYRLATAAYAQHRQLDGCSA